MRVALVVGHSEDSQGATAVDGVQEWAWTKPLVEEIASKLEGKAEARIFYRPTSGNYSRRMGALCNAVNAYKPDVVVSFHFNATESHLAHGTEALHYPGSQKGEAWARLLARTTAKAQGTKLLRKTGAKAQKTSWSGAPLHILTLTKAPAVILESHFGDHAEDHEKATTARDEGTTATKLAAALLKGPAKDLQKV